MNASKVDIAGALGGTKFILKPGKQTIIEPKELNKRKAAVCVGKTLKSAIANAENNAELSADKLYVARAVIENGPTIPRYWPRARGSAAPIRKKMSHVRVTLTDEKPSKKK